MVWTKTYTSSVSFQESNEANSLTVLNEYFGTWLDSKGWSTAVHDNTGTDKTYHYASKNIQLLGGSTRRYAICIEHNHTTPAHSLLHYFYDSGHTPSTSGPSASSYFTDNVESRHEGTWSFWTDTSDADCFAVVTDNGRCIAFWPPEETLIGTTWPSGRPASEPSWPITPFLVNDTSANNYHYNYDYSGGSTRIPGVNNNSTNYDVDTPAAFYNYAHLMTDDRNTYFYDSSGLTGMYVGDTDESNLTTDTGTLLVGSTYYIRLGTDNSILLNCGTNDPAV
jgi:hypothetical protein